MSGKKGRRKGEGRKKLAYGVIAVALILAFFLTYSFLHQSNQPSDDNATQPKAAIVDQLSFKEETKNKTFKQNATNILNTAGFNVTYHRGETVTVDFYRYLSTHGYSLIILRAHSAIMKDTSILALFTSERYLGAEDAHTKYPEDVENDRLAKAYFSDEERAQNISYFAILPKFVEESMEGEFENTIIIMMGCDGLKYDNMAQAFISKGAKVCVGWNGLVSSPHTDHATTCLLQHLTQGNTVRSAVDETMDKVGPEELYFQVQGYNSTLEYYPTAAGSYVLQCTLGIFSMDAMRANIVLVKDEEKRTID